MTLAERARTFQAPEYNCADAIKKQQMLWAAIEGTRYKTLPPLKFSFIATGLRIVNLAILQKPFETPSDVRPPRNRLFHKFGVVAKVRFVCNPDNGFTGLYRTGTVGVIRLSIGLNETFYFPGVGLKLLVDRQPSQNIVCVHSMDPQNSKDFFALDKTNVLAAPKHLPFALGWSLSAWWMGLVADPLKLSIEHLAAINADGSKVARPRTPEQIYLRSGPLNFDPATTEDFREELGRIRPGTTIYRMFGLDQIDSAKEIYIGEIQTESHFVASTFGDRVLSFAHVGWGR